MLVRLLEWPRYEEHGVYLTLVCLRQWKVILFWKSLEMPICLYSFENQVVELRVALMEFIPMHLNVLSLKERQQS